MQRPSSNGLHVPQAALLAALLAAQLVAQLAALLAVRLAAGVSKLQGT